MVAACCRLCYDQYLKSDSTIDEPKFQQFYKKRYKTDQDAEILKVARSYQPNKTGLFQFLKRIPKPVIFYKYSMIVDGTEIEICQCPCHIEGMTCLH